MKRRLLCLMPALVMALLTGCALAQPVRESAGADRWVGYYMVYVPQDGMDAGSASDLRPQGIVWGEWDETTQSLTFPDMAGSALLMFGREDERITVPSVTEMSPGPEESRVSSSEQGDSFSVSGTVWWGPPLDADTPFYSFSSGGSVFHQSDYTYRGDDGTLRTDTLRMTVAMEYTPGSPPCGWWNLTGMTNPSAPRTCLCRRTCLPSRQGRTPPGWRWRRRVPRAWSAPATA